VFSGFWVVLPDANFYIRVPTWIWSKAMETRLLQFGVFALYQLSVLLGIVLLPIALLAQRMGVRVPLDRVLERLDEAYEHATPN